MHRVDIHADLAQTTAQELTLRRQTGRRRRIFGQHQHLHAGCSHGAARFTAAWAESKHQNPSSGGLVRASQLLELNP
jgi:hypothetical protein